jgi:hypothetical protein
MPYSRTSFITAIDAGFGETIPPVDLASVVAHGALVHDSREPAGELPSG